MEIEMKVFFFDSLSFERWKKVFINVLRVGIFLVPVYFYSTSLGLSLKWEKKPGERMLLLMDFVYASNEHKTFK